MNHELIFCLVALTVIIGAWSTKRYFTTKYIQSKKREQRLANHPNFLHSLFSQAQNSERKLRPKIADNHFEAISTKIKDYFYLDEIFYLTLNIDGLSQITNPDMTSKHPLVMSYIETNHTSIISELQIKPLISKTINQPKTNNQYNLYISQSFPSKGKTSNVINFIICLQTQDLSISDHNKIQLIEEERANLFTALGALEIALYADT